MSFAETHTMILCGDLKALPFPIEHLDAMDARVEVGRTVQRKLEHLREHMEHVFLSAGLREAYARETYLVTDHGSTGVRNFIVDHDFTDVYVHAKRMLKHALNDPAKKAAVIKEANQSKIRMQLVLPQFDEPAPRYTFSGIYNCFTEGKGVLVKTTFHARYDFHHNFDYPDHEVEEEVCNCACYQVRL